MPRYPWRYSQTATSFLCCMQPWTVGSLPSSFRSPSLVASHRRASFRLLILDSSSARPCLRSVVTRRRCQRPSLPLTRSSQQLCYWRRLPAISSVVGIRHIAMATLTLAVLGTRSNELRLRRRGMSTPEVYPSRVSHEDGSRRS